MNGSITRREALEQGISRGVLYGPQWASVSHGIFVPARAPRELIDQCRHVSPILPIGAAMSHWTAARLWELWLPNVPDWLPLQATIQPGMQRPERSGLYVARSRAGLPFPDHISGVPVLSPALVVGQLAEDLELLDLVAAIDGVLHSRQSTIADVLAGL